MNFADGRLIIYAEFMILLFREINVTRKIPPKKLRSVFFYFTKC